VFVGLTGGMGCGKSVARGVFARLDWMVLDADGICHSLYDSSEGEFGALLRERWGERALKNDGTGLDREKIASIVFNSPEERNWLISLVHPAVLQKALEIHASQQDRETLFEVPLLFEANWEGRFDAVIAVWAEDSTRKHRLRERGMTDAEIKKRDSAQMSAERKMEMSDFALINNGGLESLEAQCVLVSNTLKSGRASHEKKME
jgi:dephospho-CoA kinase